VVSEELIEQSRGCCRAWRIAVILTMMSSPAKAGDPVLRGAGELNRDAAAYWIIRFRG
jgi:hypothetical protein